MMMKACPSMEDIFKTQAMATSGPVMNKYRLKFLSSSDTMLMPRPSTLT